MHGESKFLTVQHSVVVRVRKLPHFAKHLDKIVYEGTFFGGNPGLLLPCWADVTSSSPPLQLCLQCNSLHFFCWWFVQVFIRIIKLIWISPVTFPLSCSNVLKISSYFGLSFATTQPNSSDPSSTPTPPGMVDWNETIRIGPTGIHYRNFPEFTKNYWLVHFSSPIIVSIDKHIGLLSWK